MRRNKLCLYIHCVWGTWDRQPLITPAVERRIHRSIAAEAIGLGCQVLALNGVADHVHLLVTLPSTVTIAELLKQTKGVSSNFANDQLFPNRRFKWEGGYGAFSVSRWDVEKIMGYVRKQKSHHAQNELWPDFEASIEEVNTPDAPVLPAAWQAVSEEWQQEIRQLEG
ncbi:MAG: IS200/IS605 family transposase [Caldilineaceae bacterium]